MLFAAREGCLDCARALVEHGAKIDLPDPEGVTAYFFVNEQQTDKEKVDLNGNPEPLAKRWMEMVGPRPAPEPDPDPDLE